MKRIGIIAVVLFAVGLLFGTVRNPDFWSTPDRRGDALMHARKYAEAAKAYADPWRIGVAQYRDGDFKTAAKTFARVPGATGAFNQANASLMHGAYESAIASYDRALGYRPGWKDAEENKAIAVARKAKMVASGEEREDEQADAYKPDEEKFDQEGQDQKSDEKESAPSEMSDEAMRAIWLRQVKTTPGDFLRAKFSYQAAQGKEGAE